MRLATIALPSEHGAWGFLCEPILLGLLIAPSAAGGWIGAGMLFVVLARQPARAIALGGMQAAGSARTRWAAGILLVYAVGAAACFAAGFSRAGAAAAWPLVWALPLAAVQAVYDARKRSRDLAPELAGAAALGASAASLAIAGGLSTAVGYAAWGLLTIKQITSVLYVRARLRLDKDKPAAAGASLAAQGAGVAAAAALAAAGHAPWLGAVAMAGLAARAAWGVSPLRHRVRVQVVGFQEVVFGLLFVLLAAAGYRLGI